MIAGFDSGRIEESLQVNENGEVRCRFSLDARILPGVYNIVVRILNFPYGSADILIEKQLNAVTLEIIDNNTVPLGTYGLIELNGVCEQVKDSYGDSYAPPQNDIKCSYDS